MAEWEDDELENLPDLLYDRIGPKEADQALARVAGYTECPPSFTEFITDEYFAGSNMCVGNTLYPIWRDVLNKVYPYPLLSTVSEVAISGAIGTGKSSCALVGLLYDACRFMYLKNPHQMFQLMPSTPLVIAFINATISLSQSVLVDQFVTMMMNSDFFKEKMQEAKRKEGRKAFLPHKVMIMGGSRGSHAYGRGVWQAILSELNFQGAAVKDQAVQNYVHTSRRIKSRFGRGEGLLAPGRLWLDSSRKDESGFLEVYMKTLGDRDDVLCVSKAIWESQESSGKYQFSGKKFLVFIGDQKREPFILDGPGASHGIPAELVIKVPEEFRVDFELDIYGALRDLAGVATWSGHRFITHEATLREQMNIVNPVMRPIIELDFWNQDDQLINYLVTEGPTMIDGLMVNPLSKDGAYFVHFDLAKGREGGDLAGIAIGHCIGEITLERSGRRVIHTLERDNLYRIEAVMAVRGRAGQELALSRFRNLIVHLCNLGYNVHGVSADGFQSGDLLSSCREAGIREVEELSTDRHRDAYDHFKDCMLERRVSYPIHPILLKELLALQDLGKKIDHPEDTGMSRLDRPSKDISDACAGMLYHCKLKSTGGHAIRQFEEFANKIEAAAKKPVGLKQDLKELGLRNKLKNGLGGRPRRY